MSATLLKPCADKAEPYQKLKLQGLPAEDHVGWEMQPCNISAVVQSQLWADAPGTLGPARKCQCSAGLASDGRRERVSFQIYQGSAEYKSLLFFISFSVKSTLMQAQEQLTPDTERRKAPQTLPSCPVPCRTLLL